MALEGKKVYAIIQTGGKQYRVKPGDMLNVELLKGEPGETIELSNVLLVAGEDGMKTGTDVANAVVKATVIGQMKGPKLIIFKYKPKIRYRRKTGHRQTYTRLKIGDIVL
jgi:large subunit ribosomal protein L21